MTIALILNIVLAATVVSAILGLLTWSIFAERSEPTVSLARSRRQRRAAAARVLGVSLD